MPRPLYVIQKEKLRSNIFVCVLGVDVGVGRPNKYTFNLAICFSTSSKCTCIVKNDILINALIW